MFKLFQSTLVWVRVNSRDFRLPKELLCYNSVFFEQAFSYRKDVPDEYKRVNLPFATPELFELVIHWMYTSDIVVKAKPAPMPTTYAEYLAMEKARPVSAATHAISTYLQFFKLADAIGLLGPFDIIIDRMRAVLKSSEDVLQGVHIHEASLLPRGHAARRRIVRSCTQLYVEQAVDRQGEFIFMQELLDNEEFVADMMFELGDAYRRKAARNNHGRY